MGFGSCAKLIAVVAVVLPCLMSLNLSHTYGGWTRKYTSPNPFGMDDIPDLSGKVAIVTGSNTGIGFESAEELARKGAEVIVAARSPSKGEAALERIKAVVPDAKLRFIKLDLASFTSIKTFADDFKATGLPLHILLLNAGVMKSPGESYVGKAMSYGFGQTSETFESHIGINHVGHYYLTRLLTDTLIASAPSRVVAVSSDAEHGAPAEGINFKSWHDRQADYEDGVAYGQSKLANILFASELARRMEGTGVSAYSCHPGLVVSDLARYMQENSEQEAKSMGPVMGKVMEAVNTAIMTVFVSCNLSTKDGARTQLFLATGEVPESQNGGYFVPIAEPRAPKHPLGESKELAKELWEHTEREIKAFGGSL